jgi:hypothetical protein
MSAVPMQRVRQCGGRRLCTLSGREFHVKQRGPGSLRMPHVVRASLLAEPAARRRGRARLPLPRKAIPPRPEKGSGFRLRGSAPAPGGCCFRTTRRPVLRDAGPLTAPGAQRPGPPDDTQGSPARRGPVRWRNGRPLLGSFVQDCPSAYTPQVVSPPGPLFRPEPPPGQPQDRPQWVPYSPRSALR